MLMSIWCRGGKSSPMTYKRFISSDGYFSRRDLSPLIKAIHPDMFVLETPLIQSTNLACLQALNEMCDSIEGLHPNSSNDGTDVMKPLKPIYVLKCFMRVNGQPSMVKGEVVTPKSTKAVQLTLKTPPPLCTRQRISSTILHKSLDTLLFQLGPFFRQAELESPFKGIATKQKQEREREDVFFLEDKSIVNLHALQNQIDIQTLEASFQSRDRALRRSAYFSPRTVEETEYQWRLMSEEIDAYLISGNVLIKGLDPLVEEAAMNRLRKFFFDYGANINFGVSRWRYVIVVLFDKSTIPKTTRSPSESATESESATARKNSMSKGKRKALDTTGYRCVQEGRSYLIEIPHTFKAPAMLDFLRISLPMTNPLTAYTG